MSLPIRTDRLVVRGFDSGDERELARAFADPEVIWWDRPFTPGKALAWVTRALDDYGRFGFGLYAVTLRGEGRLIGDCGLVAQTIGGEEIVEIGWHLERGAWGHGYATEAARGVVVHAADLGLRRLCSLIAAENARSRRVAERLGMTIDRSVVHAGRPHDLWVLDPAA